MKCVMVLAAVVGTLVSGGGAAQEALQKDVVKTSAGDLEITFVGHGSLAFAFGRKVIHVDPYAKAGDYAKLPKADAILVTHGHGDHLDAAALAAVRTPSRRPTPLSRGPR